MDLTTSDIWGKENKRSAENDANWIAIFFFDKINIFLTQCQFIYTEVAGTSEILHNKHAMVK